MIAAKSKHFAHLFESLSFTNTFCKETLGDPLQLNKTRQVLNSMYSLVDPTPLEKAKYPFDPKTGRLLPSKQQVSEDFTEQDEERNSRANIESILLSSSSDRKSIIDYNKYARFEFVMASNSVAKECFNSDLLTTIEDDGDDDLITGKFLLKQQEKETDLEDFVDILSGYNLLDNSTNCYAHCYGGFQFGNYAGQLGDGRAISLGQIECPLFESQEENNGSSAGDLNSQNSYNFIKPKRLWELQWKGAGHTPFSRHADGRAVLRSSIREFLGSEFMDSLGIATTRAFSLVRSKEKAVLRDEFYDNNPKYEYGAIVMRVAPSFVRFGSFDIFNYRYHPVNDKDKALEEKKNIEVLAKYVIKNHFPHLWNSGNDLTLEAKEKFAKEIVRRSAKLCADWMSVGFVHGVLNTDNMSILGLTIDYGPFGFVDYFSEDFVPNNSDGEGRYRYKNQPAIVFWNLQKLMRAFIPTLLPEEGDCFNRVLSVYAPHFEHFYLMNFRRKLGLLDSANRDGGMSVDTSEDIVNFNMFEGDSEELRSSDWELVEGFLSWMHENRADFTNFFRKLSNVKKGVESTQPSEEIVNDLLQTRMHADHTASEMVVSDLKKLLTLYSKRLSLSNVSNLLSDEERKVQMDKTNPRFILRNYLAQKVIKSAEEFDYEPLYEYYKVLRNPFENHSPELEERYGGNAPLSSRCLKLSCSS